MVDGLGSNANGILDQAGSATQPDETAPDGSGSSREVIIANNLNRYSSKCTVL
jgi:hypothetical protein